ncbi:MAG: acylphosphatase [Candidatus Paceibacterota bacterium]
MFKCIECGVSGKKLDFNYLSKIKEQAIKLGLVGTAFIKDDGGIKIIAEGKDENLKKFANKLKLNNLFHGVENFYILQKESNIKYTEFSIN